MHGIYHLACDAWYFSAVAKRWVHLPGLFRFFQASVPLSGVCIPYTPAENERQREKRGTGEGETGGGARSQRIAGSPWQQ